MTSVITGDIINSRRAANQNHWIVPLKNLLSGIGKTPKVWEIYRGDSFQVEIVKPGESFLRSLQIKACIKAVKDLDVRMSIGIGSKTFEAPKVSESNGEAFINSGEMFERLKKIKENLALQSPWPDFNREVNLMFSLASIAINKWTPISAEIVGLSLHYRELSQTGLGKKIGKKQSSVSEGQKRAHYNEIMELEKFYRSKVEEKINAS
jgi:hypothetical protein